MVSDFFEIFQISRPEAIKMCEVLFTHLKQIKGFLKSEEKYKLTAEQLGKVIILEDELKLEDARQPLFAKKPTGGNSNNELRRWRKKDKNKPTDGKRVLNTFEKHM